MRPAKFCTATINLPGRPRTAATAPSRASCRAHLRIMPIRAAPQQVGNQDNPSRRLNAIFVDMPVSPGVGHSARRGSNGNANSVSYPLAHQASQGTVSFVNSPMLAGRNPGPRAPRGASYWQIQSDDAARSRTDRASQEKTTARQRCRSEFQLIVWSASKNSRSTRSGRSALRRVGRSNGDDMSTVP